MADESTLKKCAGLLLLALMIWGVYSAIQMMDNEELKTQLKDSPIKTGAKFFFFSQAFGSITPVWKIPIGSSEIYIPYPDGTDIFGLLLFATIGTIIINSTGLKENNLLSWIVYAGFLFFGWFAWKLLAYLFFVYMGQGLGSTYLELVAIRQASIERGLKLGIPLLILTLFTFFANFGALKRE